MKKILTIIFTGILISVNAQSVELNNIKLNGNIPFEINISELKSLTKQIDSIKPIPELMDMSAADSIIYIGKTYFEFYRVSQKCELSVVYFDEKITEFNIGKLTLSNKTTEKDILVRTYVPVDQELYETIVSLDKKLFDAYNSCDMDTQTSLYSEDLEFFHDKGGLSTSKEKLLIALKNNICEKVTRTLIEGSIEVYPIKDYGAVEIGYHAFNDKKTPENKSKGSRFIMIWKKTDENWAVTRVISLH